MTGTGVIYLAADTFDNSSMAKVLSTALVVPVTVIDRIDVANIERGRTRLVLIDPISGCLGDVAELIRAIMRRGVPAAVICVSSAVASAANYYRAGASVIFTDHTEADAIHGVRKALTGRRTAPEDVTDYVLSGVQGQGMELLTPKEISTLTLIAKGYAMKEIAQHMSISPKTAETHRHNIGRKLGSNRSRLMALAIDAGLVTMDELRLAA